MRVSSFLLLLYPAIAAAQAPDLIPDYESVKRHGWEAPKDALRPDFLKNFTLQSFGFTSKSAGPGFENPIQLSGAGALTGLGVECARCILRPEMERSRYASSPFGARVAWSPRNGRFEIAGGEGGVNAWQPDNTLITHERSTSFNNQWQLQHWVSAAVAVDPEKRVWLGGIMRSVVTSQGHAKTIAGTATFSFGH